MPISNKDQMRINLASKRVERWNRERCKPADNSKPRCTSLVICAGQDKPVPSYNDKAVVYSANAKMRSSADKVARELRRNGDNFSDYHDAGYSDAPRDPAWKAGLPKVAASRADSPFKRAKIAPVVEKRKL